MKCKVDGCGAEANRKGAEMCEKHYMRFRRNGNVLSQYERAALHVVHSNGYVLVKAKGHARSWGGSRAYEHRTVFTDFHGEGPFNCHWCGAQVTWKTLHIDHLDDDKKNNDIANLAAACHVCNMGRGHGKVMQTWRKKHGIEFQGVTRTLNEWAKVIGISGAALATRFKNGWSLEKALTTPRGPRGPKPIE